MVGCRGNLSSFVWTTKGWANSQAKSEGSCFQDIILAFTVPKVKRFDLSETTADDKFCDLSQQHHTWERIRVGPWSQHHSLKSASCCLTHDCKWLLVPYANAFAKYLSSLVSASSTCKIIQLYSLSGMTWKLSILWSNDGLGRSSFWCLWRRAAGGSLPLIPFIPIVPMI